MKADWLPQRAAGGLLHITSLPSLTGIGNLGENAFSFISFLENAGFQFWQLCPVGPTGFGDSPYQVFSSFAGNPYLIDWKPIQDVRLVLDHELQSLHNLPRDQVDYGGLYENFFPIARKSFQRFSTNQSVLEHLYGSFSSFLEKNKEWLTPYCHFQSLKKEYNNLPWWEWPSDYNDDIELVREDPEFKFHQYLQYVFRGQWSKLKEYAESKNIKLIGDLPIYCAPDSSDVWSAPELFEIDVESSFFTNVAGVPPDYFNENGQYWGNPLYAWDKHVESNYSWWMKRLSSQLELFDVVRIDHFRGFNDFWSISTEHKDAKLGNWVKGPGLDFWRVTLENFPSMPFLAEDLGLISDEVRKLRSDASLLGMAVLQFAFDGDSLNLYLPHNLTHNLVLYTGTHDNDTSIGWYDSLSQEIKDNFRSYLNVSGHDVSWDMLRCAYRTVSPLVILPVQDILGLGTHARLNQPGIPQGNWTWRLTSDQLQQLHFSHTKCLREQAKICGRLLARL
ncbi:MAG: 4-alpha-glucanotransferase [Opitutales bacterium]|nr:4-alpha-glucanotransferase [Opitutales bacterium]